MTEHPEAGHGNNISMKIESAMTADGEVVPQEPFVEEIDSWAVSMSELGYVGTSFYIKEILRGVTGAAKIERPEFQEFLGAMYADGRFRKLSKGYYELVERPEVLPEGVNPQEAITLDFVDRVLDSIITYADDIFEMNQLLGAARNLAGRLLTREEIDVLRSRVQRNELVTKVAWNVFRRTSPSDVTEKPNLQPIRPIVTSERIVIVNGFEEMLRSWHKESPSREKKPFSRHRLHHKGQAFMDDSVEIPTQG